MGIDKIAYKSRIIQVLEEFIKICEEHDLKYFCHGGTAIGVVRHQGMIPWDDDIDVLMPRPDYERFIKLFSGFASNYDLMIPGETPNYYLPFVKMCDKNSTLLEFKDIPCVIGAFIDIFPLDGASSDANMRAMDWLNFRHTANKLMLLPRTSTENFKWFFDRLFKFQLRTALAEIYCAFDKKNKYQLINSRLLEIMTSHPYENSVFVGSFGSQFGTKAFWPREWFSDYVIKKFESIDVRIPIGYDKILTQVYGNYMQLPPKEKQVAPHFVAFLDLNKRFSIDEVMERLK